MDIVGLFSASVSARFFLGSREQEYRGPVRVSTYKVIRIFEARRGS